MQSTDFFINPLGITQAARQFTGGRTSVRKYGEVLWDYMCFHYEGFTKNELATHLTTCYPITETTAHHHVNAFFAYCKAVPADFIGDCSQLTKCPKGHWKLTNPTA